MQLLNEEQTYVKALIYGDPGTGKTNFGVSAPTPLILLSERQALANIREAAKRTGKTAPNALYMDSLEDYREILFALKASGPGETLEIKENGKVLLSMPYPETVVIDSLTDVGELVKEDIERISPPQTGKDGLPNWSMRHWGNLGAKMQNLIIQFRNIPAHVIFLALKVDTEVGEGVEKSRLVGPALPMKKLSGTVAAAVNVIGITHRKTVKKEVKKEDGTVDTVSETAYEVYTTGPDYAVTKPYRPLKDNEQPNFTSWVQRIRDNMKMSKAEAIAILKDDKDVKAKKVK